MWESWHITGQIGTAAPDSSIVRERHAFGNSLTLSTDALQMMNWCHSAFYFQKKKNWFHTLADDLKQQQQKQNDSCPEQQAQPKPSDIVQ